MAILEHIRNSAPYRLYLQIVVHRVPLSNRVCEIPGLILRVKKISNLHYSPNHHLLFKTSVHKNNDHNENYILCQ